MKTIRILCLILGITSLMIIPIGAIPITGSIAFSGSGSASLVSGTTTVTAASPWTIVGGTVDYAGLAGKSVSVFPISYTGSGIAAVLTAPVTPQWSFTVSGITYSFDLLALISGTTMIGSTTTVALSGTGIAHITGKADTFATWSLSGGGVGKGTLTFAFETTSATGKAVPTIPDGGTTVMLLSAAFGGLAWVNARRKR